MHRGWTILRWLLPLLAAVLVPTMAFARAGGGEGFGGGGGGGGGGDWGGGGGGGGGGDIGWLIYLAFRYPQIGVPLLLLFIAFSIYSMYHGNRYRQHRAGRRYVAEELASRRRAAVAHLAAGDPAFDALLLNQRVGRAFRQIQQAWSQQDLAPVRRFISDGILERFTLQFQEQRDAGWRNRMTNVAIQSIVPVDAHTDEFFQEATFQVEASAVDERVALSDGRVISRVPDEAFVEYWTFLRRRGAKSTGAGLIEGNCPNCGSAIGINQSETCTHCGAVLRSGEHDWVLAEITQAGEWRPREARGVPGLADLRARDPGLTLQHLEDRASVIFWRKAAADRTGSIAPLRKVAVAEFAASYATGIEFPDGRMFYADCAVGGVETLLVEPGETMNRALVNIRWSGARQEMRAGRAMPTGHRTLRSDVFVLARKAGVRSNLDRTIASAHCPSCGAPESDVAADACEFCGAILNDGSAGWVLVEIVPRDSLAAGRIMHGQPDAPPVDLPSARGLLAWMIAGMLADGRVDGRELRVLESAARARRLPKREVEAMIDAGRRGALEMPQPRDREESMRWMEAFAGMTLADGALRDQEAKLLRQLAERLGFSPIDVRMMLKRTGRVPRR